MSYTPSKDGTKIYYKLDVVDDAVGGAILIHGFGDHCERYHGFSQYLQDLGLSVLRYDYRGHGRSEGQRGHIMSFSEYLDDLRAVMAIFNEQVNCSTRFLFAHSNGSLIATHALAEISEFQEWTAAILSSPFYAIKTHVPQWKRFLGKHLSTILPSFQMPTDLKPEAMSHDPDIIAEYGRDPLIGRVASARWFTETLAAHAEVAQSALSIRIPILMQVAGDDQVTDATEALRVFDIFGTTDKQLKHYEGLYHELWFEAPQYRQPVYQDLTSFLRSQCSDLKYTAADEGER